MPPLSAAFPNAAFFMSSIRSFVVGCTGSGSRRDREPWTGHTEAGLARVDTGDA